ncbi:MAG: 2-hydroxychromene-2-carboxylate isomerase [Paracoccaceae bacterium]|nr:2-hydroxychromene-2-carboxylate isomerase [Paracoccaceae bacterium]
MARLSFWFDLASTYSYLAAMRIGPLADARGVEVKWQPFLLGPIFKAQGWETSPFEIYPAKGRYMWRDMARQAVQFGLPEVKRPEPFPQNSVQAARVALIGLDQGWGEAFCRRAFAAQFAEGRAISDPATLSAILAELGADPETVLAETQTEAVKDALRAATVLAGRFGIFGAPSFVTRGGEVFWGNDRLEEALNWAAGE